MLNAGAGRRLVEDRSSVANRTKPKTTWVEIPDRPFLEGEVRLLPPGHWPLETIAWWKVVRVMPHCRLWSESDWQYALDTARVHRLFIMSSAEKGASELRTRGRHMGINEESRRSLQIKYVEPGQPDLAPLADVTSIADAKVKARPPRKRVLAIDPDSVK